ncbi:putative transporter small subunit [Luteimonas dalianensis]|uniref:putative transporter small subunit n=1 Tax=Luteimonas dalianensis TaxID=1148196 RepID=UPI003BF43A1E
MPSCRIRKKPEGWRDYRASAGLHDARRGRAGPASIALLSFCILAWPALALGVLVLLCVALARDIRAVRKKGTGLV